MFLLFSCVCSRFDLMYWFLSCAFFLFSHQFDFPFSAWKSDVWSAIGLTHSWLSVWSVSHTPQQVSHCHIRLYSLCSWIMQNNMQCFQYRKHNSDLYEAKQKAFKPAVQIQNSCLRIYCALIWNQKIGWDSKNQLRLNRESSNTHLVLLEQISFAKMLINELFRECPNLVLGIS